VIREPRFDQLSLWPDTQDGFLHSATMSTGWAYAQASDSRPVATPDDVNDDAQAKGSDIVGLPLTIDSNSTETRATAPPLTESCQSLWHACGTPGGGGGCR
jgi:hypothetical protein